MSPIPEFIDKYHLPEGEHNCTLQEIEERFLFSKKRVEVWNKFKVLFERLQDLGLSAEVLLIDGSFVTGREKPSDVDFGVLIRPEVAKAAKNSIQDEAENDAVDFIMNTDNQHTIRGLFGAHLLVADSELGLELISETFREGLIGELRDPDPERDPTWVKKPASKGILKIIP